jgi:excisionase family DNA binding protein
MNEPELITTDEIAAWLRVSRFAIYRYLKQGMPNYRLGVKHLFKRAEVEAWMKSQAEATKLKPVEHISVRPNVTRHERELTVDEAVANLKRLVPRRR